MDLIREEQALSLMEVQKLHKEQRIQSQAQFNTSEDNYDIPEKELKKSTVEALAKTKREHKLQKLDQI